MVLTVLLLDQGLELGILVLHLGNHDIPLLELFLDNFKLLGVSKSVLRANNLLELVP